MPSLVRAAPALLVFAAAAVGCGGTTDPGAVPATCPITVAPPHPTFSGDILPAIQRSCGSATITCHGGPSASGHVDYSTPVGRTAADVRADLVGVVPSNAPPGYLRVKAGDPAHSWIVEKISQDQPGGSGFGARMPLGLPDVCAATHDAVVSWIVDGAPL